MGQTNLVTSLAIARLAVGGSAFATPRQAGRAFGLDADGNPQAPYLARLFGARDAALGVGLLTSSGDAQRQWLMIGAGCDAADALAAVAGGRAGYLPKASATLLTAVALSAVAWAALALRDAG
ncbi:hypothetical protein DSM104299_03490 [Baekduia alba]|uniref:DUF4267 domain-containing protein n=1 Tax=Baekduia alba TaxID=2997333 RepID=UPI00234254BC|nr:DUF4267 domain-containing protein [Baekduia alba]WCB94751.1 hypothetical protein DSM104299_03490 [Baekduia alba]